MANVLPRQLKKQNQKEYIFRLLSIIFLFISAIFLFAGILLVPSYMVSVVEEKSKIEQITLIRAYSASKADDTREQIFELTKDELRIVSTKSPQVSLEKLINEILLAKNNTNGISVTRIFYDVSKVSDTSEPELAILSGIADTRDDLLDFTKELESRVFFKSVDLPVPSLRNEKDLSFSLEVELRE